MYKVSQTHFGVIFIIMKKENLKSLIKECVDCFLTEMEQYDDKTNTMTPGPKDRLDGEEDGKSQLQQAAYKLNQAAGQLRTLVQVCKKNNLPNLAKSTEEMMYDIIKFTQNIK